MKILEIITRFKDVLKTLFDNLVLLPYVPYGPIVTALTTMYSVIAGIFYTEAYNTFSNEGFLHFYFNNLLYALTNFFWFAISFLLTTLLLIMVWCEVYSVLTQNKTFSEVEENNTESKKRISYIRIISSSIVFLTFSTSPIQLSSVIVNGYSKFQQLDNASIDALINFFLWITFSLSIFSIWRIIIAKTSNEKMFAWDETKLLLVKTVSLIPLCMFALISYIAFPTIILKNAFFGVFYPIISLFLFFIVDWLIIIGMQRNTISNRGGLLTTIMLIIFLILPYYFVR